MLFKNVVQTFRKKWLQLLAVGIIMFFSSFVYSSMFYTMSGLEEPTLNYLEQYNQEDFSIEMLSVLTPEELSRLDEQHHLPSNIYTLAGLHNYSADLLEHVLESRLSAIDDLFPFAAYEVRTFKELYFRAQDEDHRALAILDSEGINRAYIEQGQYPEQGHQIALTRIYAEKNSLSIGDMIDIQGDSFQISGFVLFPDYTYAVIDQSILVDNARLTLMLVNQQIFDQLQGQIQFRIAGKFDSMQDRSRHEQALMDIPEDSEAASFALGTVLTENQFRSGAIFDELRGARAFGIGFGLIIASIAILIVALMLSRVLESQRRQLGVLKALGYRRRKIALPYLVLITLVSFPMLLLGYFAGFFSGQPMQSLMLDFYLIPSVPVAHSLEAFFISILLPLAFFAALCGLILFRLLSKGALDLLHPHHTHHVNRLTRLVSRLLRRQRGKTKYKYLYILQNSGKFAIFLLGIIFSTILLLSGWMMNGMVDRMTLDLYRQTDYQYQAYADPAAETPPLKEGEEKFLVYPNAFIDDQSVQAHGISWDNQLFQLFDLNDQPITEKIRHDAVISKSLSIKSGIDAGDQLEMIVGNRTYPVTVTAVAADYTADTVYLNLETLSLMISDDSRDDLFTGIYALEKPDEAYYSTILSKQSLIDQATLLQQFFQSMVYILIGTSVLIALLILFILTSLTIEDNHYHISLLQVMGYNRKEVNAMVLHSYLVYIILSYLISLPIALFLFGWLVDFFAAGYNMVLPFQFHWTHAVFSLGILLAIYFTGTSSGRRKIARIPLQETLKAYQD